MKLNKSLGNRFKTKALVVVALLGIVPSAHALTLREYIRQVEDVDNGYRGLEQEALGNQGAREQYALLTTPYFKMSYGRLDDRKPKGNPAFQGDRIFNESYSFGLEQMTPFGIKYSLSQNFDHATITTEGAPTQNLPYPNYNDVYPKLDLSLSLWRNFLGREVRGQRDTLKFAREAGAEQASIGFLRKSIEIEEAYIEMANQQELVRITSESLERARKFLKRSQERVGKNLAERSELFQAQAGEKARMLELKREEQKLMEVGRKFNRLRGKIEDEVKDKLVLPEVSLAALKLSRNPVRLRKDLKALEALALSKEGEYDAEREKVKPELDFVVSYTPVGRALDREEAIKRVSNGQEGLYFGLNFKTPLNLALGSRLRDSFAQLSESQRYKAEDQKQIMISEWNQIIDTAANVREQFALVKELEVLQKNKADAERVKLNQGRSTLFQVLNFETEYLTTRAQRINIEYKIRQLILNLKMYE